MAFARQALFLKGYLPRLLLGLRFPVGLAGLDGKLSLLVGTLYLRLRSYLRRASSSCCSCFSHKLIAYANKSGRVVVMDDKGVKKEVGGTEDAVLPAWSPDATRLAWLQKDGRRKFDLQVARVAAP